jgi:glutathione S-transferase
MTRHFLAALEARLAASPFIAGDRLSIADITTIVCLDFARWVGVRAEGTHPAVAAYRDRWKARPSYGA